MQEITGEYYLSNSEIKLSNLFCDEFLKLDAYIYEVLRVMNGVPLFVEDHVERLSKTAEIQNTKLPYSNAEIFFQISYLIKENKLSEGNIKIVYIPNPNNKCNYSFLIYINPHQYPTKDEFINGVPVSFFSGVRINPNAKIMQTDLRENANIHKNNTNTYEVLLIDENGFITEGSRSNVFFVKDNEVLTPPTEYVLPGITRKYIIKMCNELNIPIRETSIHQNEVESMEAVFISGTSRKVLPVNMIENIKFAVNNVITRKIQTAFDDIIKVYTDSKR
jgi:branched-chain amino acid aminotransferase